MAKNAIDNNVRMDFFSWHRYSADLEQYRKDMQDVQTWVKNYPQLEPTLDFHITEWGHDSNNNAGYDSSYGAAHTVAGSIEMVGVIDKAFAFEIQDGKDPKGQQSWGRWGLFSHQDFGSIAKPRFYGLRMLERIGTQRLQLLGKGTWVKALAARGDNGQTQIVVANFDKSSRHFENVPITLENIEPGSYVIKKDYLDGTHQTTKVATDAAALKFMMPMPVNSVGFVEVTKTE